MLLNAPHRHDLSIAIVFRWNLAWLLPFNCSYLRSLNLVILVTSWVHFLFIFPQLFVHLSMRWSWFPLLLLRILSAVKLCFSGYYGQTSYFRWQPWKARGGRRVAFNTLSSHTIGFCTKLISIPQLIVTSVRRVFNVRGRYVFRIYLFNVYDSRFIARIVCWTCNAVLLVFWFTFVQSIRSACTDLIGIVLMCIQYYLDNHPIRIILQINKDPSTIDSESWNVLPLCISAEIDTSSVPYTTDHIDNMTIMDSGCSQNMPGDSTRLKNKHMIHE